MHFSSDNIPKLLRIFVLAYLLAENTQVQTIFAPGEFGYSEIKP